MICFSARIYTGEGKERKEFFEIFIELYVGLEKKWKNAHENFFLGELAQSSW